MSNAKKIALGIFVILLLGVAIGFYQWNKPHADVAKENAVNIDAPVLYQAFIKDTANIYLSAIVSVKGTIFSIDSNQIGKQVIKLNSNMEGAYINCTMENPKQGLEKGAVVCIKGICTGIGQADADMGIPADVYLVRSHFQENN